MDETREYQFGVEPKPHVTAGADEVPSGLSGHSRYQVRKRLGAGGMGTVFEAEHKLMRRTVALKVIRPDLTAVPGLVERFRREVTAAARLSHPNIVTAYDAEQAADTFFLVMEFVGGIDLASYLKQHGPLPVVEACQAVQQAARGLEHAHQHHMIHRDLKPHNLMRTAEGQVKILDFGLARLADVAPEGETGSGIVIGTADYMAPEQANDSKSADIRSDIYSLGCTLYHLLTGRVPFPGGGMLDKLRRHAQEAPTPVTELRPDIPTDLAQIVSKMMAKDPAARYQTPADVEVALKPWCAAGFQPAPQTRRVSRPIKLALTAVLAGLFIASVFLIQAWRPAETPKEKDQHSAPPGEVPSPKASTPKPPDLSKLTPLLDEDFMEPEKSRFTTRTNPKLSMAVKKGSFVMSMFPLESDKFPNRFVYEMLTPHALDDLAIQVTARIVNGTPDHGWAVLVGPSPKRIVAIKVGMGGEVMIDPQPMAGGAWIGDPVGPIRSPAVRPASEFNTVLVILRQKRSLEVYVNGESVGPPIQFDEPIGRSTPGISFWRTRNVERPEAYAEFTRVTLWEIPPP